MSLKESSTLYEVLDLTPDATPQEIRDAYLRSKSTYTRDSIALYTLIAPEEREGILKTIEEAYSILSDPESRRKYDQNHTQWAPSENPFAGPNESKSHSLAASNVISIDRVPPMESHFSSDDLLIPPATHFETLDPTTLADPIPAQPTVALKTAVSTGTVSPHSVQPQPPQPPQPEYRNIRMTFSRPGHSRFPTRNALPELEPELIQAIEMETEWKGPFLKKIREGYKISIEEMSGITKVTKNYIIAIEEDLFAKLPAPVYVRGFVTQMAKVLKLPHEKVAAVYLARYSTERNKL